MRGTTPVTVRMRATIVKNKNEKNDVNNASFWGTDIFRLLDYALPAHRTEGMGQDG